jgi:hypothetical protein
MARTACARRRCAPRPQFEPGTPAALGTLAVGASALFVLDSAPRDKFAYTLGVSGQYQVTAFDAFGRQITSTTSSATTITQGAASGPLYLRITRIAAGANTAALNVTRTPAVPVTTHRPAPRSRSARP